MSSAIGDDVDLLIVGASFAGCACAIRAAQLGLKVRLIDKKADVGDKLHTTGIIVRDAVDNNPFLQGMPAALSRRVETIRLFSPSLKELVLSSPGYYFLATDTPNLMRWLVNQAVQAGVDVHTDSLFSDAKIQADRVVVAGHGTAAFLVGADGPTSRVAKTFNMGRVQHFLYGVEHELTHTQVPDPNALYCFITKRHAKGYIAWALQGTHCVQFGAAVRYQLNAVLPNLNALQSHIQPVLNFEGAQKIGVRAGYIPCGGLVNGFAQSRVLLLGDAAGLVSPVTAGGINTAWKHGWEMGQAIAHHVQGKGEHPAVIAAQTYTRFTAKRLLRWGFDHFQTDWMFNALLHTKAMRAAAQHIYFHKR